MDLHHVRYFLAVIDYGSLKAAADAVGVTQATISQALRSLERELRTPLFRRVGRGMARTSAGHALVGPARKLLRDMATAGGAIPDAEGQLRGRVDIRSHPAVSVGALPLIVTAFRQRHPRVAITIGSVLDDEPVGPLLHDGICEIVVTHLPLDRSWGTGRRGADLEVLELGTQEYWIAYPPDVPVPPQDPMSWEQVDTPLVVVPQGGTHAMEIFRMLPEVQQARPAAVILDNREARLAFALAGVGATLIERAMAPNASAHGAQVRALTPVLTAPYGLVFDRETLSTAATAFIEVAVGHLPARPVPAPVPADPAMDRKAVAAGDN